MSTDPMSFTKTDTSKVKGLAIILLIVHHCFLRPDRYKGQIVDFAPFGEHVVNTVALSFKICVAIFVFISAYGITISYKNACGDKPPTKNQTKVLTLKRLVSLIGGYLFVFLCVQLWSLIVVRDGGFAHVYGAKPPLNWLYFLIDAAGLGELFGTPMFLATFWYMSLAFLIVVLMPVLLRAYGRFGLVVLFPLCVLFRVLVVPTSEMHYVYLPNYLAVIPVGIWAADKDVIARFRRWVVSQGSFMARAAIFVVALVLLCVVMVLRHFTRSTALLPVWESIIPLLICCFMHAFINRLPIVSGVLDVLGRYSMDIFLVHNFIRVIWYYDFTYSFKNWMLIAIVLLAISLAVAFVLEKLKHLLRYDVLLTRLRSACDNEQAC